MLRKIDTRDLQPGMYLQELCGTWVDHPFWRTSFKLKDSGQIAKIINSGIKEALIDTDKGLDVEVVQRAGDTQAQSASLTGHAAAGMASACAVRTGQP